MRAAGDKDTVIPRYKEGPVLLEHTPAGVKDEHEVKIINLRFGENLEEVLNKFRQRFDQL
jgi:hypothetical protein